MTQDRIICGDCREVLAGMDAGSVHCCVTSPPYWGLRRYAGEQTVTWADGDFALGLEPTPESYVAHIVECMAAVRRVLRDDATLWLNMGDSYCGQPTGSQGGIFGDRPSKKACFEAMLDKKENAKDYGCLKPKDLCMMPFRVYSALQADGWWLRSIIIWNKPNPMPESVTDRPTTAHEYVGLFSKAARYYYDQDAIREAQATPYRSSDFIPKSAKDKKAEYPTAATGASRNNRSDEIICAGRNKRTVWTVPTAPFSGAKLLADYVGSDGKPYKVSPDCPIHGRLRGLQKTQMVACGEQQGLSVDRILDKSNHHGSAPLNDNASIPSQGVCPTLPANTSAQIDENNAESKSGDSSRTAVPQINHGTMHIPEKPACSSGSDGRMCSQTAKQHNNESHKKGRAPLTNSSCNSSGGKNSRTDGTQVEPESNERGDHIPVNNTAEDSALDVSRSGLSERTGDHIVCNSISSCSNGNTTKCTCQELRIDHFATFPPKLVEPMIKAGTSERGVCGRCGAPWTRLTKKQMPQTRKVVARTAPGQNPQGAFSKERFDDPIEIETVGWQPSCPRGSCAAAYPDQILMGSSQITPAVVLDPFAGAGTVGLVAKQLARNYVLIDCSQEYCDMAEKRIGAWLC